MRTIPSAIILSASALFVLGLGCQSELGPKDKSPLADTKSGVERYDNIERSTIAVEWDELQTIETAHPYANDENRTWTVQGSADAVEMRVVFDRLDLEDGYDFVYVSDASGEQVARLGGQDDGREIVVPGNRVDILLNSDYSITRFGFSATVYERAGCICPELYAPMCGEDGRTYGSGCEAACAGVVIARPGACSEAWMRVPRRVESPHPYANNFRNTWTITEGGAEQIRVHFSKIDFERGYDVLQVLDSADRVVHEYTGNGDDVTTPAVAGDTIKLRLVTDYSVTRFGFSVDYYEVQGGCNVDADCQSGEQCIQPQCIRAPCFRLCAPTGYQSVTITELQNSPARYANQQVEVLAEPELGPAACTRRACTAANPCCNTCGAGFRIEDIELAGADGQTYGCNGNECDPQQTCNPGFTGYGRQGMYRFRGTFEVEQYGSRLVVDSFQAASCQTGGCSGQVCSNSSGLISTCEWRDEYACYRGASCEAQADGFCAWTETSSLLQCLADATRPTGATFTSQDTPLSIPDGVAGGVSSTLDVAYTGGATAIRLDAAISHTYRGDLKVTVRAPNGREQVLHERTGGSFDDLAIGGVDLFRMADGLPNGTWTLKVEDLANYDVGTLDAWSLTVE